MSFEADDNEHERTVESDNKQIIRLLKAQIFLLEIIAGVENGDAISVIGEDQ